MPDLVAAENFVLIRGIKDTRSTLSVWSADPWPRLRSWLVYSGVITVGLLASVLLISKLIDPDPTPLLLPGVHFQASLADVAFVLYRNSLVLALHAMACVAGFMAGSSMPQVAESKSGLSRWVHQKAGPFAIAFVVAATTFSLFTQAYALGAGTSTLSAQLDISSVVLILGLLPHALPELVALFLPLAAWMLASRRGDWHQLLAATVVTVAVAVPTLIISAFVEVYASPQLLVSLAG